MEKTTSTLPGINISHLGKRKIIFKMPFLGDMLVPWRVSSRSFGHILLRESTHMKKYTWVNHRLKSAFFGGKISSLDAKNLMWQNLSKFILCLPFWNKHQGKKLSFLWCGTFFVKGHLHWCLCKYAAIYIYMCVCIRAYIKIYISKLSKKTSNTSDRKAWSISGVLPKTNSDGFQNLFSCGKNILRLKLKSKVQLRSMKREPYIYMYIEYT